MKVGILTLNYNGKENTLKLLESLRKLKTENCELRTLVVDNASSDGSVLEIKQKFPSIDILQTGENLGFGKGLNKGFEYLKIWGAEYFFVVNNDSIIGDEKVLEKLIEVCKKDSNIGMVSPKILFEKGFEFHKDRYSNEDLGKVIWYAGGKFDWDNVASVHRGIDEVDKGQFDLEEQVTFISGACFLITKEALHSVKGFTDDYFLYFEDAKVCKELTEKGFKLFYTSKTFIYHKVSQSTGIGSSLTDYYHTRNRLIFGMEYASSRTKFALIREAVKLLFFGRSAQRLGILDYLLGIRGHATQFDNKKDEIVYPFKLSIGIVNYNTPDLTKKLLESIFKKSSGFDEKNMEVIVLDNGKVDPSESAIKEYMNRIKFLKNEENEGFSKGYNKTIKYSLGQYYLMLNSDIEVLENALKELVLVEDEFKGEIALGGKLVYPDGSSQDSSFHLPTITGAIKEYFLLKSGSYFMFMPKGERPTKVEGVVMACLLLSRKVIEKVGLLDEGTFIFFEDIEYARRLKQFNIPTYFVPKAQFIHHHGASTKKVGVDKSYGLLKEASKHYHGAFYFNILNIILRLGQKFGRIQTPVARWIKN